MRAVVQRVSRGSVFVEGKEIGSIGRGVVVLLGVGMGDDLSHARFLADKTANLRIFEDLEGKMNLSLLDIQGDALVVSQFTLYGDCRKGRRPSFIHAAPPEEAQGLYLKFCDFLRETGVKVETGQFQAMMKVEIINEGPVTLLLEK
ncbi:D-aminoacyl-tRNA deacylase [Candidatus Contubernalis alkaliaceticus]|uniref:D-aminoacyl-tRNA deacylase n=1 Tax=Candidatus Contubernalis alkaliaceticus TaxID=338645 RepID=UPI001F4C525B|nr:D-aminoacyl-tRNA deacylase [Candidatus Contubernalis alkalaceticus]UNC92890.1 D-tyrosyl-tRNA(Tyr) deacylase [Candidatus Contubernalis alkalaceticus]